MDLGVVTAFLNVATPVMSRLLSEPLARVAEQNRLVNEHFEVEFANRGLSREQIASKSIPELTGALLEVDGFLRSPEQLGTLSLCRTPEESKSYYVECESPDADRSHPVLTLTAEPLLNDRKQLILERLTSLASQVGADQSKSVEAMVPTDDANTDRAKLAARVAEQTNEIAELRNRLIEQYNARQQDAARSQAETVAASVREEALAEAERARAELERKHKSRLEWFRAIGERAPVASLLGALLLLVMIGCFIAAMFTGTEVPSLIANAFLLILGYFFGSSTASSGQQAISARS
jgi:hypothetical protein